MKLKLTLLIAFSAALFSGCGTTRFVPQEYPLRDGLIPKLTLNGKPAVSNAQPSTDEAIVYSYMGTKLASNYKEITQLMVDQTRKEIAKAGGKAADGKPKTIEIKVTYLKSTYIAFYWRSQLNYTAILGGTTTIEKTVKHGSGILIQDLNGCVAESVMDLLNDPRVIAYLAE